MKIEQYIYIVVVILSMASCGTARKSHKEDIEVEREAVRHELTEMSGIGVERWSAWMSEGLSMTATEVHYSVPDSSGNQHITKAVFREVEAKRDGAGTGEVMDSMDVIAEASEQTDEDIEVEVEEAKENGLLFVVFVVFVAIALASFLSKLH